MLPGDDVDPSLCLPLVPLVLSGARWFAVVVVVVVFRTPLVTVLVVVPLVVEGLVAAESPLVSPLRPEGGSPWTGFTATSIWKWEGEKKGLNNK